MKRDVDIGQMYTVSQWTTFFEEFSLGSREYKWHGQGGNGHPMGSKRESSLPFLTQTQLRCFGAHNISPAYRPLGREVEMEVGFNPHTSDSVSHVYVRKLYAEAWVSF